MALLLESRSLFALMAADMARILLLKLILFLEKESGNALLASKLLFWARVYFELGGVRVSRKYCLLIFVLA